MKKKHIRFDWAAIKIKAKEKAKVEITIQVALRMMKKKIRIHKLLRQPN